MKMIREKADLAILAISNATVWLTDFEAVLKVLLLLVSIGYAAHRWYDWNKHKDDKRTSDE
jgi:hypothetical protein